MKTHLMKRNKPFLSLTRMLAAIVSILGLEPLGCAKSWRICLAMARRGRTINSKTLITRTRARKSKPYTHSFRAFLIGTNFESIRKLRVANVLIACKLLG